MKQTSGMHHFMHLHKEIQNPCLFSAFCDIIMLFRFAFFRNDVYKGRELKHHDEGKEARCRGCGSRDTLCCVQLCLAAEERHADRVFRQCRRG